MTKYPTASQMLLDLKSLGVSRRSIAKELECSAAMLADVEKGVKGAGCKSIDAIAALGSFWTVREVKEDVLQENELTPLKAAIARADEQLDVATAHDAAERWLQEQRAQAKDAPVLNNVVGVVLRKQDLLDEPYPLDSVAQQALYAKIRADEMDKPLESDSIAQVHPNQVADYQGTPFSWPRVGRIAVLTVAVGLMFAAALAIAAKADLTQTTMQAAK